MDFGKAMEAMKRGARVFRSEWSVRWIQIQYPDAGSVNTLLYIYMRYPMAQRVPWIPNQQDLLSDDWMVID